MMLAGRLDRKSGEGFCDYSGPKSPKPSTSLQTVW
jgi:3-hydroxyacyl-CoA dehydrogenase